MSYGAVFGGTTGGTDAIEVLDTDGELVTAWGASTAYITADDDYVYAAIGSTAYKYDYAGTQIWSRSHGDTIRAIAVDSSGNVYIAGNRTSDLTHRKLDASDGSIVWSKDHGDTVYAIAVDGSGNVYIGAWPVSTSSLRKYNSSGTLQWSKAHGGSVYAVTTDSSGNVYMGGVRASSVTHRKYNSSGTQQWTGDHGAGVFAIATDDSAVYIVGESASSVTHRKLDASDGSVTWSKDHGGTVRGIAVDPDGSVYIAGNRVSSVTHRKLDASGDVVWSKDRGYTVYSVATYYYQSPIAKPPGLPFPISLAVPFLTFAFFPPGLAFPISLASPTVPVPPLPPDWTGPPPQTVYRCYLTGGTTLLEIPIASFQCRRYIGESTWLTVILPNYSAAWAAALADRSGGQLVIYAGVRAADGVETMGEMMRAWLTDVEATREAWHSQIRLTGRVVPVSFTAQTRTLQSVQSWAADDDRWEVVCAVDPLLRPNDTAVTGSISFTVGSIDYLISPSRSSMTVKEVTDG